MREQSLETVWFFAPLNKLHRSILKMALCGASEKKNFQKKDWGQQKGESIDGSIGNRVLTIMELKLLAYLDTYGADMLALQVASFKKVLCGASKNKNFQKKDWGQQKGESIDGSIGNRLLTNKESKLCRKACLNLKWRSGRQESSSTGFYAENGSMWCKPKKQLPKKIEANKREKA